MHESSRIFSNSTNFETGLSIIFVPIDVPKLLVIRVIRKNSWNFVLII